jgi:hypothetical protein
MPMMLSARPSPDLVPNLLTSFTHGPAASGRVTTAGHVLDDPLTSLYSKQKRRFLLKRLDCECRMRAFDLETPSLTSVQASVLRQDRHARPVSRRIERDRER